MSSSDIVTMKIMVASAYIFGVTAFFVMPKMRMGRVSKPLPEVK